MSYCLKNRPVAESVLITRYLLLNICIFTKFIQIEKIFTLKKPTGSFDLFGKYLNEEDLSLLQT